MKEGKKKEETIKIELTKEECEIFRWLWRHFELWKRAKKELRPGSLVLHFNTKNELKKREFHIYET